MKVTYTLSQAYEHGARNWYVIANITDRDGLVTRRREGCLHKTREQAQKAADACAYAVESRLTDGYIRPRGL